MSLPLYALGSLAPLYSPLWQRWLRYSVRLYLALGEPGVNVHRAETHLRLAERKLLNDLCQHKHSAPTEPAQARAILEHEQAKLLSCDADVEILLAELSAEEAVQHLPLGEAPN